jgi:hypothetical protein
MGAGSVENNCLPSKGTYSPARATNRLKNKSFLCPSSDSHSRTARALNDQGAGRDGSPPHRAAHLAGKDLARNLTTLHGQMRKIGLQGTCKVTLFYRRPGTNANENLPAFHELALEKLRLPADRATGS